MAQAADPQGQAVVDARRKQAADRFLHSEDGYGGKTEWDDILIKHGIKEAPPIKPSDDELALRQLEAMQTRDPLNDKTLEELSDLEDDLDDDVLQGYRQKRLDELQAQADRNKFGSVQNITKADYIKEVNKAGDGVWVVLHLYVDGKRECTLLDECMTVLAKKFPAVKFLRIKGADCVANFPAASCPTLFLYYEDNLALQVEGTAKFGGARMTPETLEWVLAGVGVMKTEMRHSPMEKPNQIKVKRTGFLGRGGAGDDRADPYSDDDGDSGDDDTGLDAYTSTLLD